MNFTVLIPARLASTRLPDKPLADIAGAPMVVRVAQRAARSQASQVVVAADDARIVEACRAHGVQALLTRADHASGSDRLAEACEQLGLDGDAIVVNVQGDEPLISTGMIDALRAAAARAPRLRDGDRGACDRRRGRLRQPQRREGGARRRRARAVLFARADAALARPARCRRHLQHCPAAAAPRRACMPTAPRSCAAFRRCRTRRSRALESLEQLRVLWHGERIAVHVSDDRARPGRGHARGPGARARHLARRLKRGVAGCVLSSFDNERAGSLPRRPCD